MNCGHPFIRTFGTFDPLPLVQFLPEEGLSDEEAIKLIALDPIDAVAVTAVPLAPKRKGRRISNLDANELCDRYCLQGKPLQLVRTRWCWVMVEVLVVNPRNRTPWKGT